MKRPIKPNKPSSSNLFFCHHNNDDLNIFLLIICRMDKKTFFDRVLKVEHGKGGHRGL